jgi:hypothetical protein
MGDWGIQVKRPLDAYGMGVRCDPHPYATCACGKQSANLVFHAEADHRPGARIAACVECTPAALERVVAHYGGRK